MRIGQHALEMAAYLKTELHRKHIPFFYEPPTNQLFIILPDQTINALSGQVDFCFWEKYGDTHSVVRLATSWATEKEDINRLLSLL